MFEFLRHLKEDARSKRLIEERYVYNQDFPYRSRFFEEINFNDEITLSIQASGVHSSKPEKTLKDLSQYEAFELGIKDPKVANFVTAEFATSDKELSKMMRDYFDGSIYNNVPTTLVEAIFQKLKNRHGLQEESLQGN